MGVQFFVETCRAWEATMQRREEMNRLFDQIDDDGKRYVLAVLRGEVERVRALSRTRLRLVDSGDIVSGLPNGQFNPQSVSRTG